MFKSLKSLFSKKQSPRKVLSSKEKATAAGEPWVEILSFNISGDSIDEGNFELDWNDIFIARLVKAGYKGKTDADIIDQWFQMICRNVVLETYQQEMADPTNRTVPWTAH